jgi:transposase-like protein
MTGQAVDGGRRQRMAEASGKLGAKKEAAILALLSARSVEEAARTANVPPRTLYRWLNHPEFDAVFRRAKRSAFGQAIARLQQGSSAAATTMLKLMLDTSVPASTRLRAADCVLGHAKNAIEIEEIEARLAALEANSDKTPDRNRVPH